jgi:bacillithiol system protein YtxJ
MKTGYFQTLSTRCSISRMALKQFENEFDLSDKVTPYFLDLIAHRVFLMEQVVWCDASITSIVVDWEGKSV